jgi:hypothetical protein
MVEQAEVRALNQSAKPARTQPNSSRTWGVDPVRAGSRRPARSSPRASANSSRWRSGPARDSRRRGLHRPPVRSVLLSWSPRQNPSRARQAGSRARELSAERLPGFERSADGARLDGAAARCPWQNPMPRREGTRSGPRRILCGCRPGQGQGAFGQAAYRCERAPARPVCCR